MKKIITDVLSKKYKKDMAAARAITPYLKKIPENKKMKVAMKMVRQIKKFREGLRQELQNETKKKPRPRKKFSRQEEKFPLTQV